MEKIASNAVLTAEQRQKIAAFAFATALASPVVNLSQEQVKAASDKFMDGLRKSQVRHEKLVDMLTEHVKGTARA